MDHLVYIRLSYTKDVVNNELKILEENHYYPFGLKHQKYTSGSKGLKAIDESTARPSSLTSTPYNYRYNGKEFQDELGLNMYDMDMRQYDPAIARWVVLDPVIHHSMSLYNAFDNNPVFWADPSGADNIFDGADGVSALSVTVMGTGTTISAGGASSSKSSSSSSSSSNQNSEFDWDSVTFVGDYPDATELDEVVVNDMSQLEGAIEDRVVNQAYPMWNNAGNSNYYGWTGFNGVGGVGSAYAAYKSGFLKSNELWHKTKTKGTSFRFQSKWGNPGAKYWRGQQTKGFQNAKNFGNKLNKLEALLLLLI